MLVSPECPWQSSQCKCMQGPRLCTLGYNVVLGVFGRALTREIPVRQWARPGFERHSFEAVQHCHAIAGRQAPVHAAMAGALSLKQARNKGAAIADPSGACEALAMRELGWC